MEQTAPTATSSISFLRLRHILNYPIVIVGIITVFGALLRLYHLGYKSLWLDEAIIYRIAVHPLSEIVGYNAGNNSAPPTFVIFLHLLMTWGDSEFVMRLLPWVGGVFSLPAVYFLARQFLDRIPSYFTVGVVAIAAQMIYYAQQLREYSFTFCVMCLMLAYFYRFLRVPSWQRWGWMTAAFVAGVLLQYGLSLVMVAFNFIFLLEWRFVPASRRTVLLQWIASQVMVGVAAGVVVFLSLQAQMRLAFGKEYMDYAYWQGTFDSLYEVVIGGMGRLLTFTFPAPTIATLCFGSLLVIGLWRAWHSVERRTFLLFLFIPLGLFITLGLTLVYPFSGERQTIFLTPMVFVLAGQGMAFLWEQTQYRGAAIYIVLSLLFGGIYTSVQELNSPGTEHLRPIIETMNTQYQPGDQIYVFGWTRPAFEYYYRNETRAWIGTTASWYEPKTNFDHIETLIAEPGRLWLVFSFCETIDCKAIPDYLAQSYPIELVDEEPFVYLYLVP